MFCVLGERRKGRTRAEAAGTEETRHGGQAGKRLGQGRGAGAGSGYVVGNADDEGELWRGRSMKKGSTEGGESKAKNIKRSY